MKRKTLLLLGVSLALLLVVTGMAFAANPYQHYFDCKNCHFPNSAMASMSADHVCLKCHTGASVTAPNDKLLPPLASAVDPTGAADGKPGMINWKGRGVFSTGDASNKFGHNPAPGKQTSHNWAASNVQPAAGSNEPVKTTYAGFYSRYGVSLGKVTCTRCHNPHGEAVIDANADYDPVTRTGIDNPLGNPKLLIADSQNANKPIDPEKMCRACHATFDQSPGNHGLVGHPVNTTAGADTYATVIASQSSKYNATPAVPTAPYDKSYPTLVGGKVTCLSCHNLHYVDSDSTTADGLTWATSLGTGDGNLLKGDGLQFVNDPARSVTFCNSCHKYATGFHGSGPSAIGCMGCHGGHNNSNPTNPSYYMLSANYTTWATTSAAKSTVWAGTQAGVIDGFCENCHGNFEGAAFNSVRVHIPGEDCSSCHLGHGDGAFSQPIGCDGCHGSPPKLNAPGNPLAAGWATSGYAWAPSGSGTASQYSYSTSTHLKDESTTPHTSHSGTTSRYSFQCKVCHNTHIDKFATTHNKDNTSFRDVLEATSPYDAKVQAGAAIPAYNDGHPSGTCSNLYCHSNGGVNDGVGTRTFGFTAAPWAAGGKNSIVGTANECGSCHGNDATDMLPAGKNNSAAHIKHLNAGFSCNTCHTATAASATAYLGGTPPAEHMNKSVDVAFTSAALKAGGAAVAFPAGSFNGAADTTCDTVYCHSNGNMNAGETVYRSINWTSATALTCTSCHNVPGAPGDKQTAAHAAHVNGSTSSVGRNLDCGVCHDNTMDVGNNGALGTGGLAFHVNGKVDTKMNIFGIDTTTCSNISCHSNGNFEIGATLTYNSPNPVWTSGTTYGCANCHGNGTVSYPTYANGGPGVNSNSHVKHIVGGGYACSECHSQTTASNTAIDGTDKTKHVNRSVEVSGTKIASYTDGSETCSVASCHGAGSPVWGGVIASCRNCHASASADVDSFTLNGTVATIALDEWTYSGHGKSSAANYDVTARAGAAFDTAAGTGDGCLYCHDGNVSHGAANYFRLRQNGQPDLNGACLGCHATGSAGVDPDGGAAVYASKNSATKIDKYHGGASHNATDRDAGRWCWDCHDPHGDADVVGLRIQMVQRNPQVNPDANGIPASLATTNDVIFTDNTIGAGAGGFARDAAPYSEGICNTCHTAANTDQFTQTTGSGGSHSTAKCTTCHKHSGDTTYDNLAFKGSGCNGCHGNSVAGNYWPDDYAGAAMPTANNAGRHAKHIEALASRVYGQTPAQLLADAASDTKQRTLCAYCHTTPGSDGDHGVLANLPADVNSMKNLWAPYAVDDAVYSSLSTAGNDTCSSVNCHDNKLTTDNTYGWYDAGTSACIMCHSDVTAEATHVSHLSANVTYGRSVACADCHDSATAWGTPGTKPAANHIDGTFNVSGNVALTYDNAQVRACGANDCHNDGRMGSPAKGYKWGTNDNSGGCDYCHTQGLAHTPHFASTGTFVSNFATLAGNCNLCHTHSGPNAAHINKTITIAAGVNYSGTNLGVAQSPSYGTCTTTTCHQNGKGTAVAPPAWNVAWTGDACDLCHFNGSASKAKTASHVAHVGSYSNNSYTAAAADNSTSGLTGEYRLNCAKCHTNALASHLNSASWAAPTVDVLAAVNYSAGTCSNNSCHNDGSGAGVGNDANLVANWTSGWVGELDSDDCNNCHGNSPTTNAHQVHAVGIHATDIYSGTTGKLTTATATKSHGDSTNSTTISCNVCHSSTVSMARNKFGSECVTCHGADTNNSTNIMSVNVRTNHADGTRQVAFTSLAGFKSKAQIRNDIAAVGSLNAYWTRNGGYKAAASYDAAKTPDTPTYSNGSCSTIACHNGLDANWEAPQNKCTQCHVVLTQ